MSGGFPGSGEFDATEDPRVAAQIGRVAAEHDRFAFDDAAYLLGALSAEDRLAYETHLRECPLCQSSVDELSELPRLLEQADLPAWTSEQPPETLLPRLLRQVQREGRKRLIRASAIGLSAACLVTLLVFLGTSVWHKEHKAQVVAMHSVASGEQTVWANVMLSESDEGTTIKLTCGYHTVGAYDPPTSPDKLPWYHMVVINRSGEATTLGSWPAPQPGENVVVGKTTHWSKSDIATVEVTTATGKPLLRVDL